MSLSKAAIGAGDGSECDEAAQDRDEVPLDHFETIYLSVRQAAAVEEAAQTPSAAPAAVIRYYLGILVG